MMERLTTRCDGRPVLAKGYEERFSEPSLFFMLLNRVAAYEDAMPLERAQELAQAEIDGRLAMFPFVAMVEQSLQNGKMIPKRDQIFNGRYAVVYVDKKKWPSPMIDICGKYYDREEAEAALKKREDQAHD